MLVVQAPLPCPKPAVCVKCSCCTISMQLNWFAVLLQQQLYLCIVSGSRALAWQHKLAGHLTAFAYFYSLQDKFCHLHPSFSACGTRCTCHVPAGAKPGARRQKGQTLAEWEAAEGGPVKESLVGMAAVKRALRRKQQRGESARQVLLSHQACRGSLLCQAYTQAAAAAAARAVLQASSSSPALHCSSDGPAQFYMLPPFRAGGL